VRRSYGRLGLHRNASCSSGYCCMNAYGLRHLRSDMDCRTMTSLPTRRLLGTWQAECVFAHEVWFRVLEPLALPASHRHRVLPFSIGGCRPTRCSRHQCEKASTPSSSWEPSAFGRSETRGSSMVPSVPCCTIYFCC